jgi:hypothetical protein
MRESYDFPFYNPEHAIYPEPPNSLIFSLMIITTYNPIILVLGIRSIRKPF